LSLIAAVRARAMAWRKEGLVLRIRSAIRITQQSEEWGPGSFNA
jgi:hypothetical protein